MNVQGKRLRLLYAGVILVLIIIGCVFYASSYKKSGETYDNGNSTQTEIILYAAKSLNRACDELIELYKQGHSDITVKGCYDSSGTLMQGILNGHDVDIFFSAGMSQMETLKQEELLAGDYTKLLKNRVCLVTYKDSKTAVSGFMDIAKADSIALAHGSVPVGRYTRQALVNSGLVSPLTAPELQTGNADIAKLTAKSISESLGGVVINECSNVGAVAAAVAEGANEIGTVYYSDVYGREDDLVIIEMLSEELTGEVEYPIAMLRNSAASEEVAEFYDFLRSKEAHKIYEKYKFIAGNK